MNKPEGTKTYKDIAVAHRAWVGSLPDLVVPVITTEAGTQVAHLVPFDKTRVFPYAYRHCYAQRHADAGVHPDVLKELMDNRLITTTQGYYRIGAERRREAVDRVTALQFDRHGNRVWRAAQSLLDSAHVRRAIGEVATPYGVCREPSNVAAGGHACPLRFRCLGCEHFSTDVSYLPDLQAHLADLLRSRERLMSAFEADEWARTQAMPSQEEISRVRRPSTASAPTSTNSPPRTVRRSNRPSPSCAPRAPSTSACPASASPCPTSDPQGSTRRDHSHERRPPGRYRTPPYPRDERDHHRPARGSPLTASAIARTARVDRTFLYRHRDLLDALHTAAHEPATPSGTGPTVTSASLQADLANAGARSARLAARVQQLEERLSKALGEEIWRVSGLGPPGDVAELNSQITRLEQSNVELTRALEERQAELEAARAANRDLTRALNQKS